MREWWREVKWESRSGHERGREKEERDWRSSKAFFRFCFFASMRFSAAEIAFNVAIVKLGFWRERESACVCVLGIERLTE